MSKMADIDQTLTDIAKKHLAIDTLEPQNSDTLDFHLLAVWTLEAMLKEAYLAGQVNATLLAGQAIRQMSDETFEEFRAS